MALDYDWENSVGYWICAASHSLRRALDARLVKEGITIRQWEVLAYLSARGCGSQSELADQLGIEPNTLVGVLKRMENAKLIIRKCAQKDRRKKTIHPTKKAEKLWEQVSKITHEIRKQAVVGMQKPDLENMKSYCETIYNNFADQSGLASPFEIKTEDRKKS